MGKGLDTSSTGGDDVYLMDAIAVRREVDIDM